MVEIVLLKTDSKNRSQFDADDDEPLGVVADDLSSSVVDEFVQHPFEEESALTILADTAPKLHADSTGLFHPGILSASVLGAQGFGDDNNEEDALPITVVASQQSSNQVSLHPCTASLAKPLLSRCQGSSSIESGFRVLFLAMGALQKMIPYDDLKRSQLLNHGTYSTHFSGISSVEVACDILSAVVKGFYGSLSCPLQCVSTCEISKHCQKVLGSRVSCCIFSDILDYCPCLPSWQQLRHFTPKDRFKTVMRCFQKKTVQQLCLSQLQVPARTCKL